MTNFTCSIYLPAIFYGVSPLTFSYRPDLNCMRKNSKCFLNCMIILTMNRSYSITQDQSSSGRNEADIPLILKGTWARYPLHIQRYLQDMGRQNSHRIIFICTRRSKGVTVILFGIKRISGDIICLFINGNSLRVTYIQIGIKTDHGFAIITDKRTIPHMLIDEVGIICW